MSICRRRTETNNHKFGFTPYFLLLMGPMIPFQPKNIVRSEHVTCIYVEFHGTNKDTVQMFCGRIECWSPSLRIEYIYVCRLDLVKTVSHFCSLDKRSSMECSSIGPCYIHISVQRETLSSQSVREESTKSWEQSGFESVAIYPDDLVIFRSF